ncbi:hypothetical protein [Crocinitomix algicola]|uniref:hypothetical protein n=1 Tax=Crocinitomix algicola TaxID=1740263 RepID=UPI000871B55F|nr:hypothetical protein [Crocinitomix algicola]
MKNFKRTVVVFIGLIGMVSLTACKKYEEGPVLTLKTKKERVANTWVIEQAFRNGEDVTDDYDEFTLLTTKDGDASLAALYSFGDFSFEYETDGTWEFQSNKENLELDFDTDAADVTYQILKLEEDNMWVREKGGEDELHLMSK